jgi:vacuolar protein sorting-associated protein 13A/C
MKKNSMKLKWRKFEKWKNFEKKKKLKVKSVQIVNLFLYKNLENAKVNDKNNDTFVERMQLQVIRNLELSIRNIHIVYEDKTTKPDHPFAFGITLNYIALHVL